MEWNEQLTLRFIDLYRSKDILWNPKHHNYYNKIRKNEAWIELAKDFNTTVDECRKKVTNLLSAMRREKAKIKKTHGFPDTYETNWYAFNSLRFLWEKNNFVEAQSNTIANEVVQEIFDKAMGESAGPTESIKTQSDEKETNQPRGSKRKKHADETRSEKPTEILTTKPQPSRWEDSECDIFGTLVAKKLSKYSSELQSAVQQEIMDILFRADRTHINMSNPYHSPHSNYSCTSDVKPDVTEPETLLHSPQSSP